MKRFLGSAIVLVIVAAPSLFAQAPSDHVELGAFAEYFRMTDVTPAQNFLGLGGRVGFNVHSQHSTGG